MRVHPRFRAGRLSAERRDDSPLVNVSTIATYDIDGGQRLV
jgi:hypothetical protein